jgi:hypothetical protein
MARKSCTERLSGFATSPLISSTTRVSGDVVFASEEVVVAAAGVAALDEEVCARETGTTQARSGTTKTTEQRAARLTGKRTLSLLEHHFGGLDHGSHGVAHFQVHFLGALPRDDAVNLVVAHLQDYVRHYVAHLDFRDLANQPISR